MVEAALFIGLVIIALVELVKYFVPQISGAATIGISIVVGILVALVDQLIGVTDVTIAEGIVIALGSSGAVAVAKKVNTGTPHQV